MKLYTFQVGAQQRLGAAFSGGLIDVRAASLSFRGSRRWAARNSFPTLLPSLLAILHGGESAIDELRETVAFAAQRPAVPVGHQISYPFDAVKLLAPIPRPGKIICLSEDDPKLRRFRRFASGTPHFHLKLPTSVIGPGESVICLAGVDKLYCRASFAVVIGRSGGDPRDRRIPPTIAGWTMLNDVATPGLYEWGGLFDTFCPMGPCFHLSEELPAPLSLEIRTFVNGALVSESRAPESLRDLLPRLSQLAKLITLEPGDVIGVPWPAADGSPDPRVQLRPGDVVAAELDGLGTLENSIALTRTPEAVSPSLRH